MKLVTFSVMFSRFCRWLALSIITATLHSVAAGAAADSNGASRQGDAATVAGVNSPIILAQSFDPSAPVRPSTPAQSAAPAVQQAAPQAAPAIDAQADTPAQTPPAQQSAPMQIAPPATAQPAPRQTTQRPAARTMAVVISDPPLPRAKPAQGDTPSEEQQAAPIDPALAGPHPVPPQPGGTELSGYTGFSLQGIDLSPDLSGPMLDPGQDDGEIDIGPQESFPLSLAARLTDDSDFLPSGLVWRVFRALPGADGSFDLVEESDQPRPSFILPADDYIVHVSYGRANIAKRISLRGGAVSEEIALNAGGLRLICVDADEDELVERQVSLSIYSSEQDEYGQRKLIVEQATPGRIIRLNPGMYHVVSRYGDANAVVRADVRVEAGQLTNATIHHRAAAVMLKLVNEPGGEALANTAWSILSPGGDVVKETAGAFPVHVLASGEYSVIARHEGRLYNRDFNVEPGLDTEIELVAQ